MFEDFSWAKISLATSKMHELEIRLYTAFGDGCCNIDLFSMSSCIATRRLVHNGGYIQKPLELFSPPEIL